MDLLQGLIIFLMKLLVVIAALLSAGYGIIEWHKHFKNKKKYVIKMYHWEGEWKYAIKRKTWFGYSYIESYTEKDGKETINKTIFVHPYADCGTMLFNTEEEAKKTVNNLLYKKEM